MTDPTTAAAAAHDDRGGADDADAAGGADGTDENTEEPAAITAEMLAAYRKIPVANVSDCLDRLQGAGADIRPVHDAKRSGRLAGPAYTVKTRAGDNLYVHRALYEASPGDVLVIDGDGETTHALLGEIITTVAITRGLAGLVVNGAVRDSDFLGDRGFPVYAAGITHRGPSKTGPGELQVTVRVGDLLVSPGDLVLADGDGVLCVAAERAREVLVAARQVSADEDVKLAAARTTAAPPAWLSETTD